MIYRCLLALLLTNSLTALSQSTISTMPATIPNNGLGSITFEINANQPIFLTGMTNVFNAASGNSGPVEIWYRLGGALVTGQTTPSISTSNGWVLGLTATLVSAGNTIAANIPFSGTMIPLPANQSIGIYVNGGALGSRYMTWTAGIQSAFTDGSVTINTMPNGFGGSFPTPSIASRAFCGSITYIPQAACTGTPNAGTTTPSFTAVCPLQNFSISLTGATAAGGLAYQWQTAAAATGPWTNIPNATTGVASVSQTVDTWYRCEVTCTPSSATTISNPVQVTTLPNLAAGTYTIGAGGTYPSFNAAFAAAACGVAGPVVFQVIGSSPIFNEQLQINQIPGMSATNTIKVKGNFNTLSFAATDPSLRHTLHLNGADHLRFEDLTIEATGVASGWAVRMSNNANHNTFKRCIIRTSESSSLSTYVAFTLTQSPTVANGSQSGTASNLMIDSCQIVGGYYGLCLNGNGIAMGSRPSNNTVRNSSISNFYLYGVYAYGQNDLVLEYNDINRLSRSLISTCYGIYNFGRSPGLKILSNRIHDLSGVLGTTAFTGYLIYCSSTSGTAASPALVANNAIYNINNLGSTLYGMYMLTTDTVEVLHNTLDINSNSGTGAATVYGAYVSGNMSQFNFKNNIMQIGSSGTGAKYGLYNASTTALINSNFNAIRFTSTVGGSSNFIGAQSASLTYPTLASWTAATGRDVNSISSDPIFTNVLVGDLTPISTAYNNAGENQLAKVPLDLNRNPRSITPDLGAVEFTPTGCAPPFNVSVTNVRASSALVTFSGTAPSTNLQWGPKGFVPGTGQGATVTSLTHTITGLSGYTQYDVYLAGNCGTQNSIWVGPYSILTPVQVGWTETFVNGYDPLAAVAKPKGWAEFNAVAANPTVLVGNSSAWMVDGFLNVGTTGAVRNQVPATSVATQGWTITPGIDLGDVSHTTFFEWNMGLTLASGAQAAVMGSDDTLFVLISTNNGSTWNRSQALAKYHRNSSLSPFGGTYSVNLSAYTGLVKIAFYLESLTNSSSQIGTVNYDLFIDNTALKATATPCPAAALSLTSTTSTATVSWSVAGVATTPATIAWGPIGFIIGSGGSGANQSTATTNPFTISGLQQGTSYQVYVQSACAATLGQWAGPITFTTPCNFTLSGSYTINSNGVGVNNFNSLSSALAAITSCGITGPVTFTLAPYTHMGGLNLGMLNGSSAVNTVTFQGPTTGTATIQGAGGQVAAVVLNGTAHLTLRKLHIVHPTASGIIMTAGANNITITENVILADTSATGVTIAGIASSSDLTSVTGYGNNANNITITDNIIKGGYYGVRFNGTSATSFNTGINLSGNSITKSYLYGTYFYYMGNLTINDNVVKGLRNSINYGYYLYYVGNVSMQRNEAYVTYYGITMGYLNNQTKPAINSLIANNMMASSTNYGAYFPYLRHVNIYHNTFLGNTYGIYLLSSTTATLTSKNLNLRNNIFKGGTYALYQSSLPDSMTLDYNLYNSDAATFAFYNTAQASLAAWKASYPSLNVNSTDIPVIFNANDDLHVVNTGPNNLGTPIPSIAVDLDGDSRSATMPDIGADEFTPLANDLQLLGLIVPNNNACGDSNTSVSVIIRNLGTASQSNFAVGANVSGAATANFTGIFAGTLPSLSTDTVALGTFNSVVGGTFVFRGYVALTNDGKSSNDTLLVNRNLLDALPPIPTASIDTLCDGGFATLYFPSVTGNASYRWLTTSGDTLGTSDSLLVGPMNAADTTFVLRQTSTSGQVGPLNNTIGATSNYTAMNHYLLFTVNAPTTIHSLDVFALNSGLIDVVIQNALTTAIVQTVTVPSTGAGFNRLIVNIPLPPGDYRMGSTTTNNAGGLQRNSSGASYPYLSTDGSVTITGSSFGAASYYYFYNWQLGGGGCPRPDGEVTLYRRAAPTASFTSTPQAATLAAMNVDFDASATTNAITYDWNFGDGGTASGAQVSHSYAANGTYGVTLLATGLCGVDTLVVPVLVAGINVAESALSRSLSMYPNPTAGLFHVDFDLGSMQHAELKVVNALGQSVYVRILESASGLQHHSIDLRGHASGLYWLQITSEEGQAMQRVALQK
ncbi:MAG: T9SS type A sorting domain-containing protein [Flavobacteriaceae bacterium]|nr:T9SS type A sorting domain-containing protein [Flavobacteriaceae bacterium]